MLGFDFFYQIAEYGNENWKCNFTPREVANNAYDYLCEFELSKANEEPTETIKELCKLLTESKDGQCDCWVWQIADELGLVDMDYQDYVD